MQAGAQDAAARRSGIYEGWCDPRNYTMNPGFLGNQGFVCGGCGAFQLGYQGQGCQGCNGQGMQVPGMPGQGCIGTAGQNSPEHR